MSQWRNVKVQALMVFLRSGAYEKQIEELTLETKYVVFFV